MPSLPADWQSEVVEGERFRHQVYRRKGASAECLRVFIEGDGQPWLSRQRIASDPTPASPVMLRIALQVPGRVLYLGRPCYFGLARDAACSANDWTFARYAERVVRSMAQGLVREMEGTGVSRVALVGHSGGGVLAVLMAERLPRVRTVLTLAAPLDVAAWTQRHDYTPLFESLDPATRPGLPDDIRQLHLVGTNDSNVPPGLSERYARKNPSAQFRVLEGMKHELDGVGEAEWARRLDHWLDSAVCPSS